jgi:hypothetical protein
VYEPLQSVHNSDIEQIFVVLHQFHCRDSSTVTVKILSVISLKLPIHRLRGGGGGGVKKQNQNGGKFTTNKKIY